MCWEVGVVVEEVSDAVGGGWYDLSVFGICHWILAQLWTCVTKRMLRCVSLFCVLVIQLCFFVISSFFRFTFSGKISYFS